MPGASDWYRPQGFGRLLAMRREVLAPADTNGVRVLVGCETEYCGGGKVGISPQAAEQLDFVLVPMSHLHMRGFVAPPDLLPPRRVAALMVRRFREVVDLGLATAIPHAFLPLGYKEQTDEILSLISDEELLDCFGRSAQRGVGIETTTSFFPGLGPGQSEGFHDETFLRVLSLAKRAGCLFCFASDTHTLEGLGRSLGLEPCARALGITRQDLLELVR